MARRQVAVPYTQREIDGLDGPLRGAADAGSGAGGSGPAGVGAGAGLDGRWVASVAADDVTSDRGRCLVRVGEPSARVVPVLAGWEDEVLDLAEPRPGPSSWSVAARRPATGPGRWRRRWWSAHGRPRLSASRLRSTWLVTHLTMGTRLPELAAAAGLQGVTVLSDLLRVRAGRR